MRVTLTRAGTLTEGGPVRPAVFVVLISLLLGARWNSAAPAAQVPIGFVDDLISGGLEQASNFDFITPDRILVIEQTTARIRLIDHGAISAVDPVGIVPDVETGALDQGLLGIAVDPRWPAKPYIYVFYTAASGPSIHLRRYALTGDLDGTSGLGLTLDLASARDILADLPDDWPYNNGGTILFGSDGTLFVGVGDDIVPCASQDIHQLRGKILRLDVFSVPDGPGPAPSYQTLLAAGNPFFSDFDPRARLVWQYGLRNPWSFDVDVVNGMTAIADVGQQAYEEIDVTTMSGRNFGWPLYEGPQRKNFPCTYSDTLRLTPPSYWYKRDTPQSNAAVIMGGICRRIWFQTTGFPDEYIGNVFFADLYEGSLRRLVCGPTSCEIAPPVPGQPDSATWATGLSFPTRIRFGPDGFLWYVASGELRRISNPTPIGVPPVPAAPSTAIRRAWPVPSHGMIRFSFTLVEPGSASFSIVDARGRLIRQVLGAQDFDQGDHQASWDGLDQAGRPAAAGIYFGVLRAGDRVVSRRVVRARSGAAAP